MASLASIQAGELLKRQKIVNVTAVASAPYVQIQSCGPLAYYKVTVAATGEITLGGDNTDGTTTLYTIDLSAPAAGLDTYGELVAYINTQTLGHFRCFLIGMRPEVGTTDNTLNTLAATHLKTGATAAVRDNGLTLFGDPGITPFVVGASITNQKFTSQPSGGFSTQQAGWEKDTDCVNQIGYLSIALTAVGGYQYFIYSVDDALGVSNLIYASAAGIATGSTTIPNSNPAAIYWQSNLGQRLLVYGVGAAATSAPALSVIGYTKHLYGNVVQGSNYTGCA